MRWTGNGEERIRDGEEWNGMVKESGMECGVGVRGEVCLPVGTSSRNEH